MSPPDAPCPPVGTGGRRTDDRAASRIGTNSNPEPHGDGYPPGVALHWLDTHGMTAPPRRCDRWVLASPRPASFAELVELGVIDTDDLAVPLSAIELAGDRG